MVPSKRLCRNAFILAIFLFSLLSCATFRTAWIDQQFLPRSGFEPSWHQIFEGVYRADAVLDDPEMAVYCLRINLSEKGVSVLITPPENKIPQGYEGRLQTTTAFASRNKLQAAINATPFSPVSIFSGTPCLIAGLSISDHRLVSPPEPGYAAIAFTDDGTACIFSGTEVADLPAKRPDIRNAAGGFALLLRNGSITREEFAGKYKTERHPRSAAGISADGTILYLMVIDGKKPGHSIGATFDETAEWLSAFGADSGIMLDGGGSSSLVVAGRNGQPRLVNIPVQGCIPYIERPVANHIGIYAQQMRPADNR